jgi:transcriptional regulator with XRE-family HTH domain
MSKGTDISNNACVIFGGFIRTTRLQNGIIARDAALNSGILPSNFSKLEHGVLNPPADGNKQKQLAKAVGIMPQTPEAAKFFDLAGKANRAVPVDLADVISEDDARPLLLRTIGNKRLTEDQIKRLIEIVRGMPSADSTP